MNDSGGSRDAGAGAVAEAEAAARQTDLAERGSQQHHRPIRLLAVMRALQRPRRRHHRACRRHAPRQRADRVGRNAGDRRGPVGVLRLAVGLAHQIGQHAIEADAEFVEEFLVVQAFAHQRVRHGEQHRGVGVRPDRNPLRANRVRPVVADRTDVDHLDAGARQFRDPAAGGVRRAAALAHQRVLRIGAAEQHHQLASAARSTTTTSAARPPTAGCRRYAAGRRARAEAVVHHLIDVAADAARKR